MGAPASNGSATSASSAAQCVGKGGVASCVPGGSAGADLLECAAWFAFWATPGPLGPVRIGTPRWVGDEQCVELCLACAGVMPRLFLAQSARRLAEAPPAPR